MGARAGDRVDDRVRTRVAVAGENRLYREGLAEIFGRHPRLEIVGTAADADETLATMRDTQPDVLLLDLAMPRSIETVRMVTQTYVDARVVALGVPETEPEVIGLAEAGAVGYVGRDASIAEAIEAIERAVAGETLCTPKMAATLVRRVARLAADRAAAPLTDLTTREREVVELIDAGMTNKEIARRLQIELATVKNHVHNILEKLNVGRRGEAAAAVRSGGFRSRGGTV